MATLTEALARHDIAVADELLATVEVPVLTEPQRQGDVLIIPTDPVKNTGESIGRAGVMVVRGEATGNTHLLDAYIGPSFWQPAPQEGDDLLLGTLTVPDGSVAHLLHTDEHGCNAIGPGTYALSGKREMREVIARVAD